MTRGFGFGWKTYVVQESPPSTRRNSYSFESPKSNGRYTVKDSETYHIPDEGVADDADSEANYEAMDIHDSHSTAIVIESPTTPSVASIDNVQRLARTMPVTTEQPPPALHLYEQASPRMSTFESDTDTPEIEPATVPSSAPHGAAVQPPTRDLGAELLQPAKSTASRTAKSVASATSVGSNLSLLSKLPLPSGWEQDVDDTGKIFYLNHNDMSTHWCHPLERDPDLPPGWENVRNDYGVYYMNHSTGEATYDHPGKTPKSFSALSSDEELTAANIMHSHILRKASGVQGSQTLQSFSGGGALPSQPPDWLIMLVVDPIAISPTIDWKSMSDRDLNYFSNMADRLFDEEIAEASSQPASIRVGQLERASLRREIVMEEFRRSAERHYDEL